MDYGSVDLSGPATYVHNTPLPMTGKIKHISFYARTTNSLSLAHFRKVSACTFNVIRTVPVVGFSLGVSTVSPLVPSVYLENSGELVGG